MCAQPVWLNSSIMMKHKWDAVVTASWRKGPSVSTSKTWDSPLIENTSLCHMVVSAGSATLGLISMAAYKVLNLVLQIFASSSNLKKGDISLPFTLKSINTFDAEGLLPPDFAVRNAVSFSWKPDTNPLHVPVHSTKCAFLGHFKNRLKPVVISSSSHINVCSAIIMCCW